MFQDDDDDDDIVMVVPTKKKKPLLEEVVSKDSNGQIVVDWSKVKAGFFKRNPPPEEESTTTTDDDDDDDRHRTFSMGAPPPVNSLLTKRKRQEEEEKPLTVSNSFVSVVPEYEIAAEMPLRAPGRRHQPEVDHSTRTQRRHFQRPFANYVEFRRLVRIPRLKFQIMYDGDRKLQFLPVGVWDRLEGEDRLSDELRRTYGRDGLEQWQRCWRKLYEFGVNSERFAEDFRRLVRRYGSSRHYPMLVCANRMPQSIGDPLPRPGARVHIQGVYHSVSVTVRIHRQLTIDLKSRTALMQVNFLDLH